MKKFLNTNKIIALICLPLFILCANSNAMAQRNKTAWIKCYQGYQNAMDPYSSEQDLLATANADVDVILPSDPNEIIGTVGYDALNSVDTFQWVSANQSLPYTIYFENDSTLATAPAQRVEVRHKLHSKANMASFALGSFGFNNFVFDIPGSPSSYQTRLDLADTLGYCVDVVAGFDVVANEVFWIFQTIDPTTGLAPEGVNVGFLPINDANHSGEGFVSFTIKPKERQCVTGDSITAQASIVFDVNEAIATNVWGNTIDAVAPTTQLTGSEIDEQTLSLHFDGSDDLGGCGIKQFKLYVSVNYKSYQLYGIYLPGDDVTYTTDYNNCYRFFCLGEDNVGNIEEMKNEAEYEYGNYYLSVAVSVNEEEAGVAEGEGVYVYDAEVTVNAYANSGFEFVNWTNAGVVVSTNASYSFRISEDCNLVANFKEKGLQSLTNQLVLGWNWWSTAILLDETQGITKLQNALGCDANVVKSQMNGFVMYDNDFGWYGQLASVSNDKMYMIETSDAAEITMTGLLVETDELPIVLNKGWNWIGYPSVNKMELNETLSNLEASDGDVFKSQLSFSTYYEGFGWVGSLNYLQPGQGYMYKSSADESVTFTYSDPQRSDAVIEIPVDSIKPYWDWNPYRYADNLSAIYVIDLNGIELVDGNYEIAAISGEECRGIAQLKHIAVVDRYMAFLTVSGQEGDEIQFRLRNVDKPEEKILMAAEQITFSADAVIGSLTNPAILHFNDGYEINENICRVTLFPNPANDVLNVVGEKIEGYMLTDLAGQVLEKHDMKASQFQISISKYNPGVYLLTLYVTDGSASTHRVTIIR